jgi:hypothetical protein
VFGKKGSGKDLLFAHTIYLRDSPHYSNIRYNGATEVVPLTDIALGDNTFLNCIEGDIHKVEPRFGERCDIYISDGGIYLSSQYDKILNDVYLSMPIFYALSRHLYDNNIHVNVQNLGRLWIKLREQADSYIKVLRTTDRSDFLYVDVICYDNYTSAAEGLLPNRSKQFMATHGSIVARTIKINKGELEYNSRYFRDVFLDLKRTEFEEVIECLTTKRRHG